jgi:hypothetical protein
MQFRDSDTRSWPEILEVLEHSGMTDYGRFPELYMAWKVARDTHDVSLLGELLARDPWILKEAKARVKDFPFFQPKREELGLIAGELSLGYVDYELHQAGLSPLDFSRGVFVCGETGSGKSYPVLRLMDQVLSFPREDRGFNVLVVQAVKRDADFLIRKHGSLRVIEWRDLRRAPFAVEGWDSADEKIGSFCGVFSSVNWLMLHGQPLFKRAVLRCFEKTNPHGSREGFPRFSQVLEEIDAAAKELRLDGYEHRNVRDHLKFVCHAFIETGEVLNSARGFTVQDFFSKEDVVLNVMAEENDYVLGTIFGDVFRDLQRFYDQHPAGRLRTLIVVDECRRLFPPGNPESRYGHDPHSSMRSFVTTRRASGIGLITITQEPESAPSWLVDNSAFVLAFPIGGKSRKQVKELLNLTEEQAGFIDRLPKQGTAVFRDRRFPRRYLVQVPSDLVVEPIMVEEVSGRMRPFIRGLIETLQPEAEDVEFVDIAAVEKEGRAQAVGVEVLRVLRENRFLTYTELRAAMRHEYGYSMKMVELGFKLLRAQRFASVVRARASKTKDGTYFALTRKAQLGLGVPESEMTSVSRFKHDLYCERVRQSLVSAGFEAVREYSEGASEPISGSEEHASVPKRIDVLALRDGKRVAYEITLSISNLVDNVFKCLELFKVDEVVIVCERKDHVQDRAVAIVAERVPAHLLEKISFVSMTDFL